MNPETPAASAGAPSGDADADALLAAFVGAHWESHYRRSFAVLRAGRAPLRGSWNWAAALVPFWLASRRLWAYQLLVPVVWAGLAAALMSAGLGWAAPVALGFLAAAAMKGYWADRWLIEDAQRVVRAVAPEGVADPGALVRIGKRGGVSLWRALFFPLLYVVVFPLLAPPKSFRDTKKKAYLAAMKCELWALAVAESSYFHDRRTYSADLAGPPPAAGDSGLRAPRCTPPYPGSSAMRVAIGVATDSGWNATATHPALPGTRCAIFGGAGPAVAPATIAGEGKCTQ